MPLRRAKGPRGRGSLLGALSTAKPRILFHTAQHAQTWLSCLGNVNFQPTSCLLHYSRTTTQRRIQAEIHTPRKFSSLASVSCPLLSCSFLRLSPRSSPAVSFSSSSASSSASTSSSTPLRGLDDLLLRRFFVVPSFEIYGGTKGLYDLGPPGAAMHQNLISLWRKHFVLEEAMLELQCPALTPSPVLHASGHVEKFSDLMVRDEITGDCHRADHLLASHLEDQLGTSSSQTSPSSSPSSPTYPRSESLVEAEATLARIETLSAEELGAALTRFQVRAPGTGNEISKPFPFNLMFGTQLGPTSQTPGFLRPETAQGIFVNFRRLLDYNAGHLPFACAQIGLAFRNEISPRGGLLRTREFTLAEIEHFLDPDKDEHARLKDVLHVHVRILSRGGVGQVREASVGDLLQEGVLASQTLAYYLARTQLFVLLCGADPARTRFRQHEANEMAHYANDCWDLELLTSQGWVECAGLADRSAYDLEAHSKAAKIDLVARETLATPTMTRRLSATLNKARVGPVFKQKAQVLAAYVAALTEERAVALQQELEGLGQATITVGSDCFAIDATMLQFKWVTEQQWVRSFTPAVVEPSFGIGRLMSALLEHAYAVRAEKEQAVLSLASAVSPIKAAVLPLTSDAAQLVLSEELTRELTSAQLPHRLDSSGASIGRRYARCDELGVPFVLTIDPAGVDDRSVTLRERDSTEQVRVSISEAAALVSSLVDGSVLWEYVRAKHTLFDAR